MHISTDKSNTQGNASTVCILIFVLPVTPYNCLHMATAKSREKTLDNITIAFC